MQESTGNNMWQAYLNEVTIEVREGVYPWFKRCYVQLIPVVEGEMKYSGMWHVVRLYCQLHCITADAIPLQRKWKFTTFYIQSLKMAAMECVRRKQITVFWTQYMLDSSDFNAGLYTKLSKLLWRNKGHKLEYFHLVSTPRPILYPHQDQPHEILKY